MRKIGGISMNTVTRLKGRLTKGKTIERYCSVYESLEESLKEVKRIKEGKEKPKTWAELYKELKQMDKKED